MTSYLGISINRNNMVLLIKNQKQHMMTAYFHVILHMWFGHVWFLCGLFVEFFFFYSLD